MKVDLRYGNGFVYLRIPEANIDQIIRPWRQEPKADNQAVLRQALTSRQARNFQNELLGKRLCVLVEDGTRDAPPDVFAKLFALLRNCSQVRFLLCTGTHNPDTVENKTISRQIEDAAGKAGISDFKVHTHDCRQDEFLSAGRTSRGTDVLFNAEVDDADVFLVAADAKVHYFAGYSNPVKNFVPGICAFKTVEQNHALALDDRATFGMHPWHKDVSRRNNPLAEDQLEGMQFIVKNRLVYALVTVSVSRKIQWAGFGPAAQVSSQAFDKIDESNTHTVRPRARLVVSPGGFPNDASLYIAQRALELTKNAVADGGEVLFLAKCSNGIGDSETIENFYDRLTAPIDEVLKSIESEYRLYSHKSYKFARMLQRLRRIWFHSQIPDDLVEAAHLHPAHQPQTVVDRWLDQDPNAKIIIVDGGNRVAIHAKK